MHEFSILFFLIEEKSLDEMENYKRKTLLGEGSYGRVYLVEDDNGKEWALKVIKVLPARKKSVLKEIALLKELSSKEKGCSPFILCIEDWKEIGEEIYILTEYLPGPSFEDFIKNIVTTRETYGLWVIEERQLIKFFLYMAKGIQTLHNLNIVHQDIKPANIVLGPTGFPVLIDFGFACEAKNDAPINLRCAPFFEGTPYYCSPEKLVRKMQSNYAVFSRLKAFYLTRYPNNADFSNLQQRSYDLKAEDVWAFGVTMYELANLDVPYKFCHTIEDVYSAAMNAPYTNPNAKFASSSRNLPWFDVIMEKCMVYNPKNRWTIGQIVDYLEDLAAEC